MRKYYKGKRLTANAREYLRAFVGNTDYARELRSYLPDHGETARDYGNRVWHLRQNYEPWLHPNKTLLDGLGQRYGGSSNEHGGSASPMFPELEELVDKELNRLLGEMIDLSHEFFTAAERGNAAKLQAIIDSGFPINYQDPETEETALHVVAGCKARKALRVLLKTGKCQHLLRDKTGRLASEVAYLSGGDPAVARLLGIKERKEATALRVAVLRRP